MTPSVQTQSKGESTVLNSRAKTGIGGVIGVTVLLLTVQLITGVQAFPL